MTTTLLPTTSTTTSTTPEITTTSTTETPSTTSPSPETNPCPTQDDINKKQTELNGLVDDKINFLLEQEKNEKELNKLKNYLNDYFTFIEFFKIGDFDKPVPVKFNQGEKRLNSKIKTWEEIFTNADLPITEEFYTVYKYTSPLGVEYEIKTLTDLVYTYDFTKDYPFFEDAYEAQQELIRLKKCKKIANDYLEWLYANGPILNPEDDRNIYNKMEKLDIYYKINVELPNLENKINTTTYIIDSDKTNIKKLEEQIVLDKLNEKICEISNTLNVKNERRRLINISAPKLNRLP